jgi:hypothetical protein
MSMTQKMSKKRREQFHHGDFEVESLILQPRRIVSKQLDRRWAVSIRRCRTRRDRDRNILALEQRISIAPWWYPSQRASFPGLVPLRKLFDLRKVVHFRNETQGVVEGAALIEECKLHSCTIRACEHEAILFHANPKPMPIYTSVVILALGFVTLTPNCLARAIISILFLDETACEIL